MKYNKLVRDKIPEVIKSRGGNAVTHIADYKEYWAKLKEKLQEEVSEFLEAENIEEMADILEVIDAILDFKKFDKAELEKVKNKKADERGKFKDKVILEES
jgi:predicted house-cleaning noncanonical NTP pyrophosphatase (MazG superfamily)